MIRKSSAKNCNLYKVDSKCLSIIAIIFTSSPVTDESPVSSSGDSNSVCPTYNISLLYIKGNLLLSELLKG